MSRPHYREPTILPLGRRGGPRARPPPSFRQTSRRPMSRPHYRESTILPWSRRGGPCARPPLFVSAKRAGLSWHRHQDEDFALGGSRESVVQRDELETRRPALRRQEGGRKLKSICGA